MLTLLNNGYHRFLNAKSVQTENYTKYCKIVEELQNEKVVQKQISKIYMPRKYLK